jgi:hypothetical protein
LDQNQKSALQKAVSAAVSGGPLRYTARFGRSPPYFNENVAQTGSRASLNTLIPLATHFSDLLNAQLSAAQ